MSSAKVKSIGPVEKRAVNVEDLSDELFGRTTRSSKAAASVKVVLPKNQKEEKETQTEEPMQVDEESLPTVVDVDKVKECKGYLGDCIVM